MPVDDKRYLDRKCPSEVCAALFKVHVDDWKEKVSDEGAFCPLCGVEAPGSDWNTTEQMGYFEHVAASHAQRVLGQAIKDDAQRFNRRQRGGFVQMSMSYRPGLPLVAMPSAALEELRQDLVCEGCECRYSTLGPAFFCPACRHNSPESTFRQSLAFARSMAAADEAIEAAVAAEFDPDTARGSVRQMLEGALVRLVGAFQPYAEALFLQHPGAAGMTYRKGAFQNLDEGSELWRKATGLGYEDHLNSAQMAELSLHSSSGDISSRTVKGSSIRSTSPSRVTRRTLSARDLLLTAGRSRRSLT